VLAGEDVHVWLAPVGWVEGTGPTSPAEADLALLSANERERAERFHLSRDRVRFVAVRSLLRRLIGRYLNVPPRSIAFSYAERGKPILVSEADYGGLRFNVSHSGQLALLAFTRDRDVGVDVEQERPFPGMLEIAARYFSEGENAALRRVPPDERTRAFFRCWVRKEAFVKAAGHGLTFPLDAFEVSVDPAEPASILSVEGDVDAPNRWLLKDLDTADGYASALIAEGRTVRVACYDGSLLPR
jgi:4'-phosphopantetheinyl transferase